MTNYNFIIIGAGIVGLATAIKILEKHPNAKLVVLEKENEIGKHQTGNNSGVIHSGIYYKPGSLKAENCKRGYKLLIDFCNEHEIEYNLCGKLIIAVNEKEESTLQLIYENGLKNELENIKMISSREIKFYEPYANGTKAIFVPSTGIIDYKVVIKKFEKLIMEKGGEIYLNTEVKNIIEKNDSVEIVTDSNTFSTEQLITCAGLHSDIIASKTESNLDVRIIPFRGEYYKIQQDKTYLVNSLIYPVPDPSFPFLGVHFTKKINGEVEAGPNAVLSFKREGYKKNSFNFNDIYSTLTWPGFHKIATKYWKMGLGEFYRSYSKTAFTKALQKLIPSVTEDDLIIGGSGVRAQACDKEGKLLDDFKFIKSKRILHVVNAPSPAATASLSIGEKITNEIT